MFVSREGEEAGKKLKVSHLKWKSRYILVVLNINGNVGGVTIHMHVYVHVYLHVHLHLHIFPSIVHREDLEQ